MLLSIAHFFSSDPDQFIVHFGYAGIFLFFITIDQFTPLPEEITLLSLGYLCSAGIFNPFLAGIASLAGFITVDVIYYFLSRSGSGFIKRITGKTRNRFAERYGERLKDHFAKTLLILCFIPRMRMFGPVFSGMMKLPFRKFLLFDMIGLVLFTAIYLSIGIVFHRSLHAVFAEVETTQHIIFFSAMLVGAIVVIFFFRKGK
ncbi:MAG TPA: DedA family protein [Bacteroidia bacterium]|nr:DedA family protein [Bacteroidia bacterium]